MKNSIEFLLIIILVITESVYSNESTLNQQEQRVVQAIAISNKYNQMMLNSFYCKYSLDITMPKQGSTVIDDENERVIFKKVEYAFKGNKKLSKDSIVDGDTWHYVKNGSQIHVRNVQVGSSGLVLIGSEDRSELKPGTPDPWSFLDGEISDHLDHLDPKSEGYVRSVEQVVEEDKEFIKVTICTPVMNPDQTKTGRDISIWYSVENGYMPVKYEHDWKGEMNISSHAEIKNLKKYNVNGNTFYLPEDYYGEIYINNEPTQRMEYSVDLDSVQINPTLPDSLFVIEIKPDDQVINKDLDIELQGEGGRDFYLDMASGSKESVSVPKKEQQLTSNYIPVCEGASIDLVYIPAGIFTMGSPDNEIGYSNDILKKCKERKEPLRDPSEGPPHEVAIENGFYVGKYEITSEQFRCFRPDYVNPLGKEFMGNHPAIVTWKEARLFCEWLSSKNEKTVRLLSEKEWEYVCRSHTQTRFFWGDSEEEAGKYANVADLSFGPELYGKEHLFNTDDKYKNIAPIGQFLPNRFGVYDMIGNAPEWCSDVYYADAYKSHRSESSPQGHVIRGGSFSAGVMFARCAARFVGDNTEAIGFRIIVEENGNGTKEDVSTESPGFSEQAMLINDERDGHVSNISYLLYSLAGIVLILLTVSLYKVKKNQKQEVDINRNHK